MRVGGRSGLMINTGQRLLDGEEVARDERIGRFEKRVERSGLKDGKLRSEGRKERVK